MRFALSLAALLAVAACTPVPPPPNPLAETVWSLQAIVQNGDSLTAENAGLPPDLLYFQADGGFRVRSCNTCSGLYELSDRHVVIRRLACTEMACPAARVELDRYVAGRSAYQFTGTPRLLRARAARRVGRRELDVGRDRALRGGEAEAEGEVRERVVE